MTLLDTCTAGLMDRRVLAFLRVIREGETNQTDAAYRMMFGGELFDAPPWQHPRRDNSTNGLHSTAAGAYQFIVGTWDECASSLGLTDFSPRSQNLAAVYLINRRGALEDVIAGRLDEAIRKCNREWASLPGSPYGQPTLTLERCHAVWDEYLARDEPAYTQPAAPIEERGVPYNPEQEAPVPLPAIALLSAFAPVLKELIPQIAALFDPAKKVAERNVGIAQVVLDTITKASGQPTLEGAVAAMQADPEVKQAVQKAVVTEPRIMEIMEIGGGIAKAREYDLAQQQNQQPFWRASAVFWISVILLPLVYWLVGSLIVGGIELPADWPWYAQAPFKLFGGIWNGESRSGGFNLVIGLVLGGICGVYYGVSVTQGRSSGSNTERQP
jgi:muramidase (phage lysozyme)